jgi:hypothetical protein
VVVKVVDRARPRDTSIKTFSLQVTYVGPILVRADGAAAVTSANLSASVTLTPGSRGDLLVAYIATYNGATVNVSGGGLNWIPAGTATDPTVGDGGLLSVWDAREPTTPPAATTVVSDITGNGSWSQTLDVVAYAGASGVGALGFDQGPGSQTPSLSLWPEAGGSLIGVVGFDPDSATEVTPGANQVLDLSAVDTVENAQMWFQHLSLSTTAGQEVTVGDSLSPSGKWDLGAAEILPQYGKR